MSKKFYCAQCGTELYTMLKPLPSQQKVITVVEPHTCPEEDPEIPWKSISNELILKDKPKNRNLGSIFDKFKFVKKLNDLEPKKSNANEVEDFQDGPGDQRDPSLRSDIKSIAPAGVLDAMKNRKP